MIIDFERIFFNVFYTHVLKQRHLNNLKYLCVFNLLIFINFNENSTKFA